MEALLPTLTVKGNDNRRGLPPKSGDGLTTALKGLLPTLTATPYGSNQGGAAGRTGPERLSLERQLKAGLLPTLTARDYRSPAASEATHARPQQRPLNETLGRLTSSRGTGWRLRPAWCEAYMGFPPGWTEISAPPDGPPPESTRRASGRSETASCRRAPRSSGG